MKLALSTIIYYVIVFTSNTACHFNYLLPVCFRYLFITHISTVIIEGSLRFLIYFGLNYKLYLTLPNSVVMVVRSLAPDIN
jgi:hypothetical protein